MGSAQKGVNLTQKRQISKYVGMHRHGHQTDHDMKDAPTLSRNRTQGSRQQDHQNRHCQIYIPVKGELIMATGTIGRRVIDANYCLGVTFHYFADWTPLA